MIGKIKADQASRERFLRPAMAAVKDFLYRQRQAPVYLHYLTNTMQNTHSYQNHQPPAIFPSDRSATELTGPNPLSTTIITTLLQNLQL